MKRFTRLYLFTAVFLAVAFFLLLRGTIRSCSIELDLGWMLTAISSLVEGKSGWGIASFILSPAPPGLEPPVVKGFLLLATPAVGFGLRCLVWLAVGVHAANALLLHRVCRQLRLSRRAAFVAGCFYFTLLAHFHAVFWPTAFQHLAAVFTILLLLHFYLKGAFFAAMAAALLASFQRSALIGLALIGADLLLDSGGNTVRKYRRWFPMFAVSLFYPVWILASGADDIVSGMILHSGLPERVRDFFLTDGATHTPIQTGLKYPLLFAAGLAGLVAVGGFLRIWSRWASGRKILFLCAAALLSGGVFLQWFQDKRQLLFFYNALGPFVTTLAAFLSPIQTAMKMGNPESSHYYLPPQISFPGIAGSLLLLWIFAVGFAARKRRLALWCVWYLLCLAFLLRHQYTSFPVVSPSRYFIYLSPCVAVVFSSVGVLGYLKLARALRFKPLQREGILLGILLSLCLGNLAAIRLASWRGKLPNAYYAYEDLRTAHFLARDLSGDGKGALSFTVEGLEPMAPMQRIGGAHYVHVDPSRQDNLRIALGQEIGYLPATTGGTRRYLVRQSRLLDAQGRRIDPFGRLLERGFSESKLGHREQAIGLLEQAVLEKPFLLDYCLAPGLRYEDLRWLTGGQGFREWVGRVSADWRAPDRKFESVRSTMEEELAEYVLALLELSHLEDQQGRTEKSRYWLSQTRFMEPDPWVLRDWLGRQPVFRDHPDLSPQLLRLEDPEVSWDPLPWRKDDYGFGRFLLRFLFGMEIRSEWDNRFNRL